MTVVLCPTRGGKSSIPNQKWAIQFNLRCWGCGRSRCFGGKKCR